MMFLSRIELNTTRRETLRAFADASVFHGAVEEALPGPREGRRTLWRIDRLRGVHYLMIVSEAEPEMTAIVKTFGSPDVPGQTLDYAPFLSRLAAAQIWRFRLRANPVHAVSDPDAPSARGKIMAHVTPEQQRKWLKDRAERLGCRFAEFDVTAREWKRFHKAGKRPIPMRVVDFEGVLEIVDAVKFRDALTSGVGREKAFGCGLLTVARLG